MRTIILILPALVSMCFGAVIPKRQELGSGTTVSARPHETFTIVVPCNGAADCVARTITLETRDEPSIVPRNPVPQTIVTVSRTVIVGPTSKPVSTSTKKPCGTATIKNRQVLGSPTRSVPNWPWWPTNTSPTSIRTVTVTVTYTPPTSGYPTTSRLTSTDYGTSRTVSSTLAVTPDKRQVLASPTRSVIVGPTGWPWFPIPPHVPTSIEIPTSLTTSRDIITNAATSRVATSTLASTLNRRQDFSGGSQDAEV